MSTRLKPYPSYKDSGVEWLGRIPAQWKVERLGFHTDLLTGFPFKSELFSTEDGIALVRGDNVTEGVLRWGDKTRRWPHSIKGLEQYFLKPKDVLVGMDGSKVGKNYTMIQEQDLPLILVQRVARLRVGASLDSRFLLHFIGSELFRTWVAIRKTDPAIPHISPTDIRHFPITTPSTVEQRAIAEFLDRETGKIDALVKKKERLIELLQEKRTALISHTVTQGLNPNAPKKDSGIPWLGRIPAHWDSIELRRVVSSTRPITYGIVQPGALDPSGILMVRGQDYSTGWATADSIFRVSPAIELPYRRSRLAPGDIVMTIVGAGVGNVAIVPDWLNLANITQTTARIAVEHRRANNRFVNYSFQSEAGMANVRNSTRGAAQPGLTLGSVARFRLAVPPLDEQKTIADFLDRETAKLDALMAKVRTAIERLQEYRTALISAAVTGQIDVRKGAA